MKFSLVLPVYGVEKYIAKCLESCCEQRGFSPKDYEIIIVNDETPDDSIKIAKETLARYPEHQWKIVDRKNGGLSAARNSGLAEASGDYVWFIDSDDFIEPDALAILDKAAGKGKFDIITFTHRTIKKNLSSTGDNPRFAEYSCRGADYMVHADFLSAWTCVYAKAYLMYNHLRFKEGVIWEDSEFNTRAYMLAQNCYCICDTLYNYIRRDNSISDARATPFAINSRISNALGLDEYFRSKAFPKKDLCAAYSSIASMLVTAIAGLPELEEEDRKKYELMLRQHKREYCRIMRRCADTRSKIILLCYLFFPIFSERLLNKKIHEAINRATK